MSDFAKDTNVLANDSISRKAVLDLIDGWTYDLCNNEDAWKATEEIENLPSAQERKKGRWKPFDLTWGRSIYFCTACNDAAKVPTSYDKPIYKYCPNCGAEMEKSDE